MLRRFTKYGFQFALLLLVCLASARVWAWESVKQIVHGTARVLEKKEMMVGIISPLAYGVHERVTIFTHPALALILTPNIFGRMAIWNKDMAASLEGGYIQSLFVLQGASSKFAPRPYTGSVNLGLCISYATSNKFEITGAAGYLGVLFPQNGGDYDAGWYWRFALQWLINKKNATFLITRGAYTKSRGFTIPVANLIYARQFGRMRLGAGLSIGSFLVQSEYITYWEINLPVIPWLDIWWRF